MRGKTQLSVLLALVFFAAQFATLTHNAEFGRHHDHHDHHQHEHHDSHQVSFAPFGAPDQEPANDPLGELCEFVLQADRTAAADVADVQSSVTLEFSESRYDWAHTISDDISHVTIAHARAPPTST